MNILPEIAAALTHRKQMREELDALNKKIAVHPRNLHEELSENLTRLKKNLSGTLVSETVTKRTKTARKPTARAPRGMRQWMLYASIKDCSERGNTRETHNTYYFNLSDIWNHTLERLYRTSVEDYDTKASGALKEDFETFQSSSRTRISSDHLFESEPERGRYHIVNYSDLINSLNKLDENREEFETYLQSL